MLRFPTITNPHVHIFGTGGTGGFAVEYMSRLFAASHQKVTIELYDGDTVETKNLKRQNFTMDDLDLNKATGLVKRMTNQVPQPPKFVTHTEYVTDADELTANILLSTEDNETLIFVLAVDNIATRRLLNTVIDNLKDTISIIAIDSGNDNQGGQVVLYANTNVVDINLMGQTKVVTLVNMLQLFPEIDVIKDERDENPGLTSYCAEESDSKPQSMMANVRNGEIIASIVYQLSQNQAIPFNVWFSDILTNNTNGVLKGIQNVN